jgi:hypothetical protein
LIVEAFVIGGLLLMSGAGRKKDPKKPGDPLKNTAPSTGDLMPGNVKNVLGPDQLAQPDAGGPAPATSPNVDTSGSGAPSSSKFQDAGGNTDAFRAAGDAYLAATARKPTTKEVFYVDPATHTLKAAFVRTAPPSTPPAPKPVASGEASKTTVKRAL